VIVEDDGAGIDADRVREEAVNRDLFTREQANQLSDEQCFELLFRPGFSTKDEVTGLLAGGWDGRCVYDHQAVDGGASKCIVSRMLGRRSAFNSGVACNFADAVHRSWRR